MIYKFDKTIRETEAAKQALAYLEDCENERRMSAQTMRSKFYTINHFLRSRQITDLKQISTTDIREWIKGMTEDGNKASANNSRLSQVMSMLRWYRDDGMTFPNLKFSAIHRAIEDAPRQVCFSRPQVYRVLKLADREEWLMIKICFDAGLRIGELVNMRTNDVKQNKIRVIGKGKKLRWTMMSNETRKRLDDWIEREHIKGYIFPKKDSTDHISNWTARNRMKKVFRKAGYNNFCPHDLRHSYATDLKHLGTPTRLIQKGLGHASQKTTERYLRDLDGVDVEEIYKYKFLNDEDGLR